jgi:hypothetical protein
MSMFNPLQPVNGWGALGAPPIAMLAGQNTVIAQQQFTTLTASVVPSSLPLGNPGVVSTDIAHVTIAPVGAGTITFAHGLLHTPTMCWIIPEIAEGTTPTLFAAPVVTDFNATTITVNVSGAGTYDVFYV